MTHWKYIYPRLLGHHWPRSMVMLRVVVSHGLSWFRLRVLTRHRRSNPSMKRFVNVSLLNIQIQLHYYCFIKILSKTLNKKMAWERILYLPTRLTGETLMIHWKHIYPRVLGHHRQRSMVMLRVVVSHGLSWFRLRVLTRHRRSHQDGVINVDARRRMKDRWWNVRLLK